MTENTSISSQHKRTLLLKIISKKETKPEDVDSVIELTSSKIVDLIQAQYNSPQFLDSYLRMIYT